MTDSLVSSISAHRCLIAWKAPIFWPNCSRTPAYSTAVSRHHRATPEASAAARVTTSDRSRSGREAGDHRCLERGQRHRWTYDGSGPARSPGPGRRSSRETSSTSSPRTTQGVRGTGGVVDQAVGTQRERDPHLPRGDRTGQLTERHGCDRRAEQRAGHQRAGSRLERDREVQQGAAGAADCLGHGDPGQPHLGHCRGLLGERRLRVVLRLPGRLDARRASSPTCRRRPPARRGRRRSRWARALLLDDGKLERVPIMPCRPVASPEASDRQPLTASASGLDGSRSLGCARDRDARRAARARPRREGVHARGRGRVPARHRPGAPRRWVPRWRSAPTAASRRSTSAPRPGRPGAWSSPWTTTAARRRTRPAGSTTTRAWSTPSSA